MCTVRLMVPWYSTKNAATERLEGGCCGHSGDRVPAFLIRIAHPFLFSCNPLCVIGGFLTSFPLLALCNSSTLPTFHTSGFAAPRRQLRNQRIIVWTYRPTILELQAEIRAVAAHNAADKLVTLAAVTSYSTSALPLDIESFTFILPPTHPSAPTTQRRCTF